VRERAQNKERSRGGRKREFGGLRIGAAMSWHAAPGAALEPSAQPPAFAIHGIAAPLVAFVPAKKKNPAGDGRVEGSAAFRDQAFGAEPAMLSDSWMFSATLSVF